MSDFRSRCTLERKEKQRMAEQMTLGRALTVLDDYFLHTSSQIAPKAYAVIRDHLNAARGEAVATNKVTLTAPEQIYLQISDEPTDRNEEFSDAYATWCSESVLACEVKYIRADLAQAASPDVVRDAERINLLEKWCSEGCVDMGIELDGGVYFSLAIIGKPDIQLREKNTIREAIDDMAVREVVE